MTLARLKHPIVLVHGLLGFNCLRVAGRTISYFPGIGDFLGTAGNRVAGASLDPTGGVRARALQLQAFIHSQFGSEPVHVLAHSMGGLDARYMVSRLGMAEQVLTLTTLGTPHRGCSFADWGIDHLGKYLRPMLRLFRVPDDAFYDLTTDGCRNFNASVPDVAGVRYFSVAGCCDGTLLAWPWTLPRAVVNRVEGPNDGVVSVSSATYGEHTDVWDGDHLSLANWPGPAGHAWTPWKPRTLEYGQLVNRLADCGF